jgi:hypothetical protein
VKEIIRDVQDLKNDPQKERLVWLTRFAPLQVRRFWVGLHLLTLQSCRVLRQNIANTGESIMKLRNFDATVDPSWVKICRV